MTRTARWAVAADAGGRPTVRGCAHLGMLPGEISTRVTAGCRDCLREGGDWVHLRECAVCGHVGCCDDSPNRHATAHHQATGHPLIRSLQPGERWAWCYPDGLFLVYA